MKMILIVLLAALISLATSQQGTPECTAAALALAAQADCQLAVDSITASNFTQDQFDLACNDTLECNRLYRSVVQSCSPELPGDLVQLVCAMPAANNTCAHVLFVNVTYDYLYDTFLPEVDTRCSNSYISGENCTTECMEFLMGHTARFGCCWTEILAYLATDTGLAAGRATSYIGFYDWCGISTSFCDNRPLPEQTVCDSVLRDLYNGSDCSEAISSFITSNFDFFNELAGITTIEGCTSQFIQFGESCGSLNSTLGVYAYFLGPLDQANDPDGLPCTTHAQDLFFDYFLGSVTDENVCIYDYTRGRCSANCRQSLVDISDQYGCCLNELIRTALVFSSSAQDQINYALVTSELYSFCDVPSPGFCVQPTSVQYSETATKCISAANKVFEIDNTCTEGFIEIMERNSIGSVAIGAQEICVVQQCRDRLPNFVDYLTACDGLDDNENVQQDFGYLSELANHTTCKTNGTISCLGILQQSPTALTVASAFDPEEGTGICLSVFEPGNFVCSRECQQLLQTGDRELGCCLSEFGVAFLENDGFNHLLTQCRLTSDRCNDIEVNNNDPCFTAREAIQDDTDCNDAFTAILNTEINVISRTMINEINNYLKTLCSDPGCASATSNYFTHCQSLLSLDPALNEIRNNYNSFACLQSDVNAIDCYALDHSEPTVAALNFAFERTGSCESVLESDGICSATCRSMIDTALNYSGCCLTDIIQNSLTSDGVTNVTIEQVYAKCEIRGPKSCKDTPQANASAGTTVKGFDVLFILLFWMIVMLLV